MSSKVSEERYGAKWQRFAGPGGEDYDVWILMFADQDRGNMVFGGKDYPPGEAERLAWEAWNRVSPAWNCHLFRLAELRPATLSPPASPQGVVTREECEAVPWVVYDSTDEVYLGAEKWVDDLWDAETFSRASAEEAAEKHGGSGLSISAEPYVWHDRPKNRPPRPSPQGVEGVTEEMVEAGARGIYLAKYASIGGDWNAVETRETWLNDARACLTAALSHPLSGDPI